MKYLTKFETQSAYEAAQSSLILPNVSLIKENNNVEYNPLTPPIIDGHEYVDLGLPSGTKWATMNIGASSETDYGNYYQYGKGSEQYAATSGQSDYSGTEDPLSSSVDTAVQVWGGSWHMPTKVQIEELIANTTYEWVTIDGINGGKLIAQNGNYVFFPAAGFYYNGNNTGIGNYGHVKSSTPNGNTHAFYLYLNKNMKDLGDSYRNYGQPVRPVVG